MSAAEDPIAVIGIGCRFPGADNLEEFWTVLLKGENHVVEVPRDRGDVEEVYSRDQGVPGKIYTNKVGFIENYANFDNKLFGITESEAAEMDPQQRQVLECTYMVLENAGITRQQIAGQNVGVFIGCTVPSSSLIANRVAHAFALTGPSMTIDTTRSSSLVTIHQAANAIRAGDCEMAICGGVNILLHPDGFIPPSKAQMLSSTNHCHVFSAETDGYTRGEGCGIVILKPLSQASNDKNNIWGTIVTGLNPDGRAITAASGSQQGKLLDSMYFKYGVNPSAVEYIEADSSGTKHGDPMEVLAFGEFFTANEQTSKQRYLGSVKTNVGHLESAAGVAGLIKVLLMMKHNTIIPSLHFNKPNEEIDLDKFHFVVPTTPVPWTSRTKVACLNSFGFDGAICHAIITNYIFPNCVGEKSEDQFWIATFSGSTIETLRKSLQDFLATNKGGYGIETISFTSTVKREHFPIRKAFVARNIPDLEKQIEMYVLHRNVPEQISEKRRLIFVFCGNCTGWQGMCKELLNKNKTFSSCIADINASMKTYVSWSLVDRLEGCYDVEDPEFGPIAIFACQVALARVWEELGVRPASIVGLSLGEVAAAHVAGVLSLDEAVKVVFFRTRALAKVTGGETVIVRKFDVHRVEEICARYTGKASISAYMSPVSCAISGDSAAVDDIRFDLQCLSEKDNSILVYGLPLYAAFHTHHVDKCKDELKTVLEDLLTQPPSIQWISTVDAQIEESLLTSYEYWGLNVRQPSRFSEAIKHAAIEGYHNVFIEIGPRPLLQAHLYDNFRNTAISAVALPSLTKNGSYGDFLQSLASAYELNININWTAMYTETFIPAPVPIHAFSHTPL